MNRVQSISNKGGTGNYVPYIVGSLAAIATTSMILYLWRRSKNVFASTLYHRRSSLITLNDPTKRYPLKLVSRESLSSDTHRYRFALPTEQHILGLPTGQHIFVSAEIDGKLEERAYSPISTDDDQGYVELLVKISRKPCILSQHIEQMNIGDILYFRGPHGHITYIGGGTFELRSAIDEKQKPVRRHFTRLGMIAGGTGITPMLQLIHGILCHPEDQTKIWLLFANNTEQDILLKNELLRLAEKFPDRFKLWFTVDHTDNKAWTYSVGYVTADMISEHLPIDGDCTDTAIFMCGPPPMIKFACIPNLDMIGFPSKNRFTF